MRRDAKNARLALTPLLMMLLAMIVGSIAPSRSLGEQETETSREVEVVLLEQLVSAEFHPKIDVGDQSADLLSASLLRCVSRSSSNAIRGERSGWNGLGAALRL